MSRMASPEEAYWSILRGMPYFQYRETDRKWRCHLCAPIAGADGRVEATAIHLLTEAHKSRAMAPHVYTRGWQQKFAVAHDFHEIKDTCMMQ